MKAPNNSLLGRASATLALVAALTGSGCDSREETNYPGSETYTAQVGASRAAVASVSQVPENSAQVSGAVSPVSSQGLPAPAPTPQLDAQASAVPSVANAQSQPDNLGAKAGRITVAAADGSVKSVHSIEPNTPINSNPEASQSVEGGYTPGEVEDKTGGVDRSFFRLLAATEGGFQEKDFRERIKKELVRFDGCMDTAYQKVSEAKQLNGDDIECFEAWYNACLPLAAPDRFEQKNVCVQIRNSFADYMRAVADRYAQMR